MKHPDKSDFHTAVTDAGVVVTFKPTNSIYSFYELADSEDIARLSHVSLGSVRHAGPSGASPRVRGRVVMHCVTSFYKQKKETAN